MVNSIVCLFCYVKKYFLHLCLCAENFFSMSLCLCVCVRIAFSLPMFSIFSIAAAATVHKKEGLVEIFFILVTLQLMLMLLL